MPSGENPNSAANLKPITPKEARNLGEKGGIISGRTRRELKTLKELDSDATTNEERKSILDALKARAMAGDLDAIRIYRDSFGMKPTKKNRVSYSNTDIVIDLGATDERNDYTGKIDAIPEHLYNQGEKPNEQL